jgi:hypothetical protein
MVTIRDMVQYVSNANKNQDLKKIRSCGKKTFDEVHAFIEKEGLFSAIDKNE